MPGIVSKNECWNILLLINNSEREIENWNAKFSLLVFFLITLQYIQQTPIFKKE